MLHGRPVRPRRRRARWSSEVQPDVVVHLAGIAFVAHANADLIYRVNIVGTRNLLEALAGARHQPSAVLLASSANIYGNADVPRHRRERARRRRPTTTRVSKLAMEYMARLWIGQAADHHRAPVQLHRRRPGRQFPAAEDRLALPPRRARHRAGQPGRSRATSPTCAWWPRAYRRLLALSPAGRSLQRLLRPRPFAGAASSTRCPTSPATASRCSVNPGLRARQRRADAGRQQPQAGQRDRRDRADPAGRHAALDVPGVSALTVGLGTTMIEPGLTGGRLDGIGVYTDALLRHLPAAGCEVTPYSWPRLRGAAGAHQRRPGRCRSRSPAATLRDLADARACTACTCRPISSTSPTTASCAWTARWWRPCTTRCRSSIPSGATRACAALKNWLQRKGGAQGRPCDRAVALRGRRTGRVLRRRRAPHQRGAVRRRRGMAVGARRRTRWRRRLRGHGLRPGYFLFVGTLQPRKNVERVLDAWLALPAGGARRAPAGHRRRRRLALRAAGASACRPRVARRRERGLAEPPDRRRRAARSVCRRRRVRVPFAVRGLRHSGGRGVRVRRAGGRVEHQFAARSEPGRGARSRPAEYRRHRRRHAGAGARRRPARALHRRGPFAAPNNLPGATPRGRPPPCTAPYYQDSTDHARPSFLQNLLSRLGRRHRAGDPPDVRGHRPPWRDQRSADADARERPISTSSSKATACAACRSTSRSPRTRCRSPRFGELARMAERGRRGALPLPVAVHGPGALHRAHRQADRW